jgi:hypothetical protein
MIIIDDSIFLNRVVKRADFELNVPVGRRVITHAIHDIDGTHSLIRDWPPVMSRCLWQVIVNGLPDGYDSQENILKVSEFVGTKPLGETDKFCIESAGLSALTQMEWAIRRAIENKSITIPQCAPGSEAFRINSEIIKRIWEGEEVFDYEEPMELREFLKVNTPRLFKLYENVLYYSSRNKNLEDAVLNPSKWRVKGSMEFIKALHRLGVVNYFVTGAVVQDGDEGGIHEEALTVGFEIGHGKMIEAIIGSRWDKKMPKNEVTKELCTQLKVASENVLIIGDGRAEIQTGVDMGAVTMSRLPREAIRARQIHRDLGTNYIVTDYTVPEILDLIPSLPGFLSAASPC